MKELSAGSAIGFFLLSATMGDVTDALLALIVALLLAIIAMIPYTAALVKAWLRLKLTALEAQITNVQSTVDTNGAGVQEVE